jgi:NIPSNAP
MGILPNVHPADPSTAQITRREALGGMAAVGGVLLLGGNALAMPAAGGTTTGRISMTIICIIRYEIDPFQRDGMKKHGENLICFVPRCGGHYVGFFLPYEGTNNVAWAMVAFDSLASYEAYKARLKSDPEAREDAAWMQSKRIILREERNFVELVDGTFNLPSTFVRG